MNAKLSKAIPLGGDMERNVARPKQHVVMIGIISVLEDGRRSAVGFDDVIGEYTKLLEFRSIVEFCQERDCILIFARKLFFVE